MAELLYHYTDYLSLDGILKGRELRVNNVLNMNDAAEMELFIAGIFSAVEKRLLQNGHEEIIGRLNIMLDKIRSRYYDFSVYAACFSEYRDDAAQWERYANRGKGVCLCFHKPVLEKMTDRSISLKRVFYRDNMESHPLAERIYKLLTEHEDIDDTPELQDALHEAWCNSASFKHPSFSSEHEIRLVVMPFEVNDFPFDPGYHVAKDRIKKYYPLDLDELCSKAGATIEDLVTEIIIGPESTQSIPILRDYLRDMGLNRLAENICHSDCPLRSKM